MQQQIANLWRLASQDLMPKRLRFALANIFFSTLLAVVLSSRADVRIGDWLLTNWNSQAPAQTDIVVVAIDEQTLAALPYRSPIDRGFLASLIRHIDQGAPKSIGIDILIDQPSEPIKDSKLLQVIQTSISPVVLAYAESSDGLTEQQDKFLKQSLAGIKAGHVTIARDTFDGTVRHWPAISDKPDQVPLFAVAIAKTTSTTANARNQNLPPLSERITFLTNADGSPFTFPTYPAHAAKLLPPQWFKDKSVLIGATLPNIDQHQTPFTTRSGVNSGEIYGVKIHAHMIAQLISQQSVYSIGPLTTFTLCIMLAGLASFAFMTFNGLVYRLAVIGALLTAQIVLTLTLYRTNAIEVPVVSLIATILLASSAFTIRDWHTDWSERRFIQHAFGQYVSPALVEKISTNHEALKLGGEERDVTYIFTDLEGFTTLSESLPPEKISEILNEYLDGMCDLFIKHDATIDKIIGDAVVGLYGAPNDQPHHGNKAVSLALAIDQFSEVFRQSQTAKGIPLGVTRIGLHHGPAVVGNFGGLRFFDYTAIGDTVNTAARLEGANKYLGTRICVSQTLAERADQHQFRPIGDIVLKGKDDPVTCFEPIRKGDKKEAYLENYRKAFDCIEREPQQTEKLLNSISKEHPEDGLIRLHLGRIKTGETGIQIELESK